MNDETFQQYIAAWQEVVAACEETQHVLTEAFAPLFQFIRSQRPMMEAVLGKHTRYAMRYRKMARYRSAGERTAQPRMRLTGAGASPAAATNDQASDQR